MLNRIVFPSPRWKRRAGGVVTERGGRGRPSGEGSGSFLDPAALLTAGIGGSLPSLG